MLLARLAVPLCLALASGARGDTPAGDAVLYRYSGPTEGEPQGVLNDGASGQIAALQRAVNLVLLACGAGEGIEADGMFGPRTQAAVVAAAACPAIQGLLPEGSAAGEGAVTEALWALLLPGLPPPGSATRARALLLAFEGTDISGPAEWNFCQNNREAYDAGAANPVCTTNDPASYLTWGPQGATAGHGHEILSILARLDLLDPLLVDEAFGIEAAAVRRMQDLRIELDDDSELQRYLCGIYADPDRRALWAEGFARLGAQPAVRAVYDAVYASANFDGGKIRTFVNAWRDAGLTPTEVDFAFFADRAAQTRVRNVEVRRLLHRVLAGLPEHPAPALVRRGYARAARVTNASQRSARLGRDVAFYIDALPEGLTRAERHAWQARGAQRASAAGLSDARPAPELRVGPRDPWRASGLRPLTRDEEALCPAPVLHPRPPPRRG